MDRKSPRGWMLLALIGLAVSGCAAAQPSPTPEDTRAVPPLASTQAPTGPAAGGEATPAATEPSGAVRYELAAGSEAQYRVREQLANVDLPSDAIGKTDQVSGAIVILADGSVDAAQSKFSVDLSALQSDRPQRDNFLRRNVLQTDQYPQATFVPKQVTGLPATLPAAGEVTFQVSGDLTIHNVTRPVTWDVTGAIDGGKATGQAVTTFTFEDFNLTQPRVPVVLSVEDSIRLEVTVVLQKAG